MPPSSSDCAKDVRSPINCTVPSVFVSKYREERAKKFLDDADSMGKLSIKVSRELISIRPSKSNACSAPELEVSGADEMQPASQACSTYSDCSCTDDTFCESDASVAMLSVEACKAGRARDGAGGAGPESNSSLTQIVVNPALCGRIPREHLGNDQQHENGALVHQSE
jgi:hypothetical protein